MPSSSGSRCPQCCCECEDCCNGAWADEFDVEITLTDGDECTTCADLDGTFTLAKVLNCNWEYDSGYTLNEDCDPPYGDPVIRRLVQLSIRCISATQYGIILSYTLDRDSSLCPGRWYSDTYYWTTAVNIADFDCSTEADFHLPWQSKGGYRLIYNFWVGCVVVTATTYFCDPSADAIITAVP